MFLWKLFRRSRAVATMEELADFLNAQAAFLAQKGIYEYSRARAGHYSKVLFSEYEFQHAVEQARWRAFPLGLAMVAEMIEGVLRPVAGEDRGSVTESLSRLALSVFDHYPPPVALSNAEWRGVRQELARRLDHIGLHAVKSVKDIPETFAEPYFALMPIHEKLRGQDFQTTRNYLRVSLCNIHDEFQARAESAALVDALRARAGSAVAG